MFSKQFTSKLKEEKENANSENNTNMNVAQCDRIIRTVSCKVKNLKYAKKTKCVLKCITSPSSSVG